MVPVRLLITDGSTANCTQASKPVEQISAEYLLINNGYDGDHIASQGQAQGMTAVIPPRKNRKIQRESDEDLYMLRHLVENTSLHLKRWRSIAKIC